MNDFKFAVLVKRRILAQIVDDIELDMEAGPVIILRITNEIVWGQFYQWLFFSFHFKVFYFTFNLEIKQVCCIFEFSTYVI